MRISRPNLISSAIQHRVITVVQSTLTPRLVFMAPTPCARLWSGSPRHSILIIKTKSLTIPKTQVLVISKGLRRSRSLSSLHRARRPLAKQVQLVLESSHPHLRVRVLALVPAAQLRVKSRQARWSFPVSVLGFFSLQRTLRLLCLLALG